MFIIPNKKFFDSRHMHSAAEWFSGTNEVLIIRLFVSFSPQ